MELLTNCDVGDIMEFVPDITIIKFLKICDISNPVCCLLRAHHKEASYRKSNGYAKKIPHNFLQI